MGSAPLGGPAVKVFVIVPAYQAESTLEETIDRIPATDREHLQEILIVDDGSRDRTLDVALAIAARDPLVRVVSHEVNRGYGPALKTGLAMARASGCDVAAVLHADGQYPPERIAEFARICLGRNLSILQGSRHCSGGARAGGMPLYKILAGRVLVALENRVFGLALTDYHSGYIFHHRSALDAIPYDDLGDSFDFDLQVIASAVARGLAVGEEAIATRYANEVSHLRPVSYGLRVLRVLWSFRRGRFGMARRG